MNHDPYSRLRPGEELPVIARWPPIGQQPNKERIYGGHHNHTCTNINTTTSFIQGERINEGQHKHKKKSRQHVRQIAWPVS